MENTDGSGYGRNAYVPEENIRLTHVGAGTPMGELLRRYWHPICMSSELKELPKYLKILDEELVAYRDKSGQVGVLGAHCCHRGSSLEYGRIEQNGIRCCYHGWYFNEEGRCLDQPCEPNDSPYKDEVRQPWYPAEEYRGLVFAYMGPLDKKPLLPRYDILEDDNAEYLAYRNYSRGAIAACNWLQLHENAADPMHIFTLHGNNQSLFDFDDVMGIKPDFDFVHSDQHVSYIRTTDVEGGNRLIRTSTIFVPTAKCIPPPDVTGRDPEKETERARMVGWWIPIDNEHTIGYHIERIDPGKRVFQPPDGEVVRSYEETQRVPDDWEAQLSQRPLARHALENLATSDRGVVMFRRLLNEAISAVERGEDPPGTIRDPDKQIIVVPSGNEVIQAEKITQIS